MKLSFAGSPHGSEAAQFSDKTKLGRPLLIEPNISPSTAVPQDRHLPNFAGDETELLPV